MASVQTTAQLTARQPDHRSLLAAASRCYNEASENNPVLLSRLPTLHIRHGRLTTITSPALTCLPVSLCRANDEARHWLESGLSLKPKVPVC